MKSRDPSGDQRGPANSLAPYAPGFGLSSGSRPDAIEAGARDVVVRADGNGGSPGGTNYLRLNTR